MGRTLVACLAAVAACWMLATPAVAEVQPYQTNDFGGFHD
ncbi:MAG: hypothetical protein QOJ35_1787, partial [Solirubrobacteraceae bacterium]|nr:hypothetical protein [Solirubrobacteraceae bacterium]